MMKMRFTRNWSTLWMFLYSFPFHHFHSFSVFIFPYPNTCIILCLVSCYGHILNFMLRRLYVLKMLLFFNVFYLFISPNVRMLLFDIILLISGSYSWQMPCGLHISRQEESATFLHRCGIGWLYLLSRIWCWELYNIWCTGRYRSWNWRYGLHFYLFNYVFMLLFHCSQLF